MGLTPLETSRSKDKPRAKSGQVVVSDSRSRAPSLVHHPAPGYIHNLTLPITPLTITLQPNPLTSCRSISESRDQKSLRLHTGQLLLSTYSSELVNQPKPATQVSNSPVLDLLGAHLHTYTHVLLSREYLGSHHPSVQIQYRHRTTRSLAPQRPPEKPADRHCSNDPVCWHRSSPSIASSDPTAALIAEVSTWTHLSLPVLIPKTPPTILPRYSSPRPPAVHPLRPRAAAFAALVFFPRDTPQPAQRLRLRI